MKIKKYVLLLITLILTINFEIKNVYADGEKGTCLYVDYDDGKTTSLVVTFSETSLYTPPGEDGNGGWSEGGTSYFYTADIKVEKMDKTVGAWYGGWVFGEKYIGYTYDGNTVKQASAIDIDKIRAGDYAGGCPSYVVAYATINEDLFSGKNYRVDIYVTNSWGKASSELRRVGALEEAQTYKPHILKPVPVSEYFGVECENCVVGEDVEITCDASKEKESLFGDPKFAGTVYTNADTYKGGRYEGVYATPPSMAYMINKILGIMRIITIALVMTLGVIDIGKAVIASKEEEMKKAQNTFLKRIVACVAIFLVPTIVNIVMNISYDMWETKGFHSCTIEEINGK